MIKIREGIGEKGGREAAGYAAVSALMSPLLRKGVVVAAQG